MRRLIICLAVTLFVLSAAVSSALRTERTAKETENAAMLIAGLFRQGQPEEALSLAESTLGAWERFCADSIFLSDRERSLEITMSLMRITAALKCGSDTVDEECEAAALLIEDYRFNQRPYPANIF